MHRTNIAFTWRIVLRCLAILVSMASVGSAQAGSPTRFSLEFEGGPVWQTVNDVEIPNDGSASRFSLVDLVGKGPQAAGRVYLSWHIADRHTLRALYAPFRLTEDGVPTTDLAFNGQDFVGDETLRATYRFDSYRLSYRYRWHDGVRWQWQVGFTAKIRDARVRLRQGVVVSTKDDLGFVPLLHVAGRYRLAEDWSLRFDADALAGGPGRAIDAALKLGWQVHPNLAWELGYRTVEGGADVDEVYSFAWLHYAVTSLRLDF